MVAFTASLQHPLARETTGAEPVRPRPRQAERERTAAVGTAAAKLAREIGLPLNGMLMNLQLLERRIEGRQPHERLEVLVRRVEGEVRRMAVLLEEFRGMSQQQSFLREPVAPAALLERVAGDHRAAHEAHCIRLELRCDPALPTIHVDRTKMLQVLLNLGKNAIEAMEGAGGTLTLGACACEGGVLVTVTDTGPGVPDGIDVFEPFATTKPHHPGLGLAVAQQIVAGHGGELGYQSVAGHGTTFTVWLPLVPPQ
jgi:signal transduction histidine kinase